MPRSNPAPLKSALFLRNPRGGKRRSVKGRGRRSNGLAIRSNKAAVQRLLGRLRKNGLAIRANGKGRGRWKMPSKVRRLSNGRFARRGGSKSRRGRSRKNGLAIRANGRRSRKNGYRRNTGSYIGKATGMLTGLVRKIPIIGKPASPYVGPALTAGLALVPIHFGLKYAGGYLPDMVKPFAYTLGGVGVAAIGTAFPGQTKQFKAIMGVSAVSAGVLIDLYRYLADKMPAGFSGFGDGGAYDVIPMDDESGIRSLYADASLADAYYAGADFNPMEIRSAAAGARAWQQQFPSARRMTGVRRPLQPSRHAGQPGHRFGWLVPLIGWNGVRRLALMPTGKRQATIAEFRQKAMETLAANGGGPAAPEYRHISDQGDPDLAGIAVRYNGMVHAGGAF